MRKFDGILGQIDRALQAPEPDRSREFRSAWDAFARYAERTRRRDRRIDSADREDYMQEFMVAALRGITTHDPKRGPLRPHVLMQAERDAGRNWLRKVGWTGRDLERMPLTTSIAPVEELSEEFVHAQVEKPKLGAAIPPTMARTLLDACKDDLELDAVRIAAEHGVGELRRRAALLALWHGWTDDETAEAKVSSAFRSVLRRVRKNAIAEQQVGGE